MKKIFVVASLLMFVGSMSSTAFAASNDVKTEFVKKDDKKKKKKKSKKGSCCASGTTGTSEKKSCHTEEKK
ncbi:MAG: hypothetical protein ACK5B9_06470 [Flavobacteriia bacterium]|jgi:hypothetical protein